MLPRESAPRSQPGCAGRASERNITARATGGAHKGSSMGLQVGGGCSRIGRVHDGRRRQWVAALLWVGQVGQPHKPLRRHLHGVCLRGTDSGSDAERLHEHKPTQAIALFLTRASLRNNRYNTAGEQVVSRLATERIQL